VGELAPGAGPLHCLEYWSSQERALEVRRVPTPMLTHLPRCRWGVKRNRAESRCVIMCNIVERMVNIYYSPKCLSPSQPAEGTGIWSTRNSEAICHASTERGTTRRGPRAGRSRPAGCSRGRPVTSCSAPARRVTPAAFRSFAGCEISSRAA